MSNELRTPDGIIRELVEIRDRVSKGIEILREYEDEYTEAKFAAERAELKAFLDAQGTATDRNAVAKLLSEELRRDAEEAKKKVDYAKTLLKSLEAQQTSVQTQARLVEALYRGAGQGER